MKWMNCTNRMHKAKNQIYFYDFCEKYTISYSNRHRNNLMMHESMNILYIHKFLKVRTKGRDLEIDHIIHKL